MKNSVAEIEAIASAMFDMPKSNVKQEGASKRPVDTRTTNCIGHEIQNFTAGRGWLGCSAIFATRKEALEVMHRVELDCEDDTEYRVYEALEIKEKK